MRVNLSDIADLDDNLRRAPVAVADSDALVSSMRSLGQLQPVLLRRVSVRIGPDLQDASYAVVAGRRRIAAAAALGWEAVEALVEDVGEAGALACQAAENLVRLPMTALDAWNAVRALADRGGPDHGGDIRSVALNLGMDERQARRMERLGRLHPELLAAIESDGMPDERALAQIAAAPADVQARAMALDGRRAHGAAGEGVTWWQVARDCGIRRIPRSRAIFDVAAAGVAFQEDWFAQPLSDEQFTTYDAPGFVKAQTAALALQVKAAKKRGERVALAGWNERQHALAVPPGWIEAERSASSATPVELRAVALTGHMLGRVVSQLAVRTAKADLEEAEEDERGDGEDADPEGLGEHLPGLPPEFGGEAGVTVAGRSTMAKAREAALRTALRATPWHHENLEALVCCLLLALSGDNVHVEGEWQSDGAKSRFRDLVRRLVLPGGRIDDPDDLPGLVAEAIARIVVLPDPARPGMRNSGPAAEWIGAAVRADDHMARIDAPELLACVGGAKLRELAARSGAVNPNRSLSELRRMLPGLLPDWRPRPFGAPAPAESGAPGRVDGEVG